MFCKFTPPPYFREFSTHKKTFSRADICFLSIVVNQSVFIPKIIMQWHWLVQKVYITFFFEPILSKIDFLLKNTLKIRKVKKIKQKWKSKCSQDYLFLIKVSENTPYGFCFLKNHEIRLRRVKKYKFLFFYNIFNYEKYTALIHFFWNKKKMREV